MAVDLGKADMSSGIKSDKSISVFHCINKSRWTCIMWNIKLPKAVHALMTMPRDEVGTNDLRLRRYVISSHFDLIGSCPDTMPSKMVNFLFTKLFKDLKCTQIYRHIHMRERENWNFSCGICEQQNVLQRLEKINPCFIICFLLFISSHFSLMAKVKSLEEMYIE